MKCRSCSVEIEFVKTSKGRNAPVEGPVIRVRRNADGKTTVIDLDGEAVRGDQVPDDGTNDLSGDEVLGRVSHFATCPNANQHRRARSCKAIGVEREEKWCEAAAKRLAQESLFTARAKPAEQVALFGGTK